VPTLAGARPGETDARWPPAVIDRAGRAVVAVVPANDGAIVGAGSPPRRHFRARRTPSLAVSAIAGVA